MYKPLISRTDLFSFQSVYFEKKYFNSCGSSNSNILFSVRNWSEKVSWRDSEVYDRKRGNVVRIGRYIAT